MEVLSEAQVTIVPQNVVIWEQNEMHTSSWKDKAKRIAPRL